MTFLNLPSLHFSTFRLSLSSLLFLQPILLSCYPAILLSRYHRYLHPKHAPLPLARRFRRNVATMRRHNLLGNVKPKPRTLNLLGRSRTPRELLEKIKKAAGVSQRRV